MFKISLVPTLFRHSISVFLQSFFWTATFTLSLLWTINVDNFSLVVAVTFGLLLIIYACQTIATTSKPLGDLILLALSLGEFVRVGHLLQQQLVLRHLLWPPLLVAVYFNAESILRTTNLFGSDTDAIEIGSTYLRVLCVGVYPVCVYHSLETWLSAQRLVKLTVCVIPALGLVLLFFTLSLLDGFGPGSQQESYVEDAASLSLTLCANCVVLVCVLVLFCCGCNRNKLKGKLMSVVRRSNHGELDEQLRHLLRHSSRHPHKQAAAATEVAGEVELRRPLSMYQQGSLRSIQCYHSMHSLHKGTATSMSVESTLSVLNAWMHLVC